MKTLPDTRPGAVVWVVTGLALSAVVHLLSPEYYRDRTVIVVLSMTGSVMIGAGGAKLVHGDRVRLPSLTPTPLVRMYTLAGTACGLVHLWQLGYFAFAPSWESVIVVAMIGLWWFGGTARPNPSKARRRR